MIVILLAGWLGSCKKYNPALTNENSEFTLAVQDTAGVRDDGTSLIQIVFNKVSETENGLSVTFSSSQGKLIDSVFTLDSNNMVKTYLRVAQDTGSYYIRASINMGTTLRVQKTLIFSLRPSLPDSISFETDSTLLSTTNPLTINTYLYRKYGLVSLNTGVSFTAYQINALNATVPVGRFTGLLGNGSTATGALGPIIFHSDTQNIDITRPVTIQASTFNDQGKVITKQVTLAY